MGTKSARTGVEDNLSVFIKKRRYSAALHNVAVIHAPSRPSSLRFAQTSLHVLLNKSGSGIVRSVAAPKIPAEVLWPRRRGFFRWLLFSTFRLALVMLSRSRRATMLRRGRLTMRTLP